MAPQPLTIDLNGKSLHEVVALLQAGGFTVSATKTDMWDRRAQVMQGAKGPQPPVHVVWMKDEECSFLTATLFNGSIVTLEPGMDLHCFERYSKDERGPGQDWSALNTMNVMR